MRTVLIGGIVAAALNFAAPASTGCWATVVLAPPPEGTAPGKVWTAEITVLQQGLNPLPGATEATPTVTIVNGATGERKTFAAGASDPAEAAARPGSSSPRQGPGATRSRRLHELYLLRRHGSRAPGAA